VLLTLTDLQHTLDHTMSDPWALTCKCAHSFGAPVLLDPVTAATVETQQQAMEQHMLAAAPTNAAKIAPPPGFEHVTPACREHNLQHQQQQQHLVAAINRCKAEDTASTATAKQQIKWVSPFQALTHTPLPLPVTPTVTALQHLGFGMPLVTAASSSSGGSGGSNGSNGSSGSSHLRRASTAKLQRINRDWLAGRLQDGDLVAEAWEAVQVAEPGTLHFGWAAGLLTELEAAEAAEAAAAAAAAAAEAAAAAAAAAAAEAETAMIFSNLDSTTMVPLACPNLLPAAAPISAAKCGPPPGYEHVTPVPRQLPQLLEKYFVLPQHQQQQRCAASMSKQRASPFEAASYTPLPLCDIAFASQPTYLQEGSSTQQLHTANNHLLAVVLSNTISCINRDWLAGRLQSGGLAADAWETVHTAAPDTFEHAWAYNVLSEMVAAAAAAETAATAEGAAAEAAAAAKAVAAAEAATAAAAVAAADVEAAKFSSNLHSRFYPAIMAGVPPAAGPIAAAKCGPPPGFEHIKPVPRKMPQQHCVQRQQPSGAIMSRQVHAFGPLASPFEAASHSPLLPAATAEPTYSQPTHCWQQHTVNDTITSITREWLAAASWQVAGQ
jgi:hypothetical protein